MFDLISHYWPLAHVLADQPAFLVKGSTLACRLVQWWPPQRAKEYCHSSEWGKCTSTAPAPQGKAPGPRDPTWFHSPARCCHVEDQTVVLAPTGHQQHKVTCRSTRGLLCEGMHINCSGSPGKRYWALGHSPVSPRSQVCHSQAWTTKQAPKEPPQ